MKVKARIVDELPWLAGYSGRFVNALRRAKVDSAADLLRLSPCAFTACPGVGAKLLQDLERAKRRLMWVHGWRGPTVRLPRALPPYGASTYLSGRDPLFDCVVIWRSSEQEATRKFVGLVELDGLPFETSEYSATLVAWLYKRGFRTVGDILAANANALLALLDQQQSGGGQELDAATSRELQAAGDEALAIREELGRLQRELSDFVEFSRTCESASRWPIPKRSGPHGKVGDPREALAGGVRYDCAKSLTDWFDVIADAIASAFRRAEVRAHYQCWRLYCGFGKPAPSTLQQVGDALGVSRERVRQIVARMEQRLRSSLADPWLRNIWRSLFRGIARALYDCLGVATPEDFGRLVAKHMDWEESPRAHEIAYLGGFLQGTDLGYTLDKARNLVVHQDICHGLWQAAQAKARELLEGAREAQDIHEFAYRLTRELPAKCFAQDVRRENPVPCCGFHHGRRALPTEYVRAVVHALDPDLLDGDTVLPWCEVMLAKARRLKDALRAALQVIGRPASHEEIGRLVRERNPRFRRVNQRTIYRYLAQNKEFVLTEWGGVYGLAEWGVERYVGLRNRIRGVLQEHGKPLPIATICEALAERGYAADRVTVAIRHGPFVVLDGELVALPEWGIEAGHGHKPPAQVERPSGPFGTAEDKEEAELFDFGERDDEPLIQP